MLIKSVNIMSPKDFHAIFDSIYVIMQVNTQLLAQLKKENVNIPSVFLTMVIILFHSCSYTVRHLF